MKTKVFRKYVYDKFQKEGEGSVKLYIGIRADEADRIENSKSDNYINEIHPFIEHGIANKDVLEILNKNGIRLPDFYNWRKRSGCYFCFYQSKNDWLNLYENHPDLFKKAMEYELESLDKFKRFGWNTEMALKEMIKPENMIKIREDYKKLQERRVKNKPVSNNLFDSADEDNGSCLLCHLL